MVFPIPYTLKEKLDGGYRIRVHCEDWVGRTPCNHSADLDLAAMIERLGPDFDDMPQLRRMLRCSACGSKKVVTILHAPSGYDKPSPGRALR